MKLFSLKFLKIFFNLQKVETKDGDTIIIIYFDDVDVNEICTKIKAFRTHKVAEQKPAAIVVYDYYDNCELTLTFLNAFNLFLILFLARRATTFYSAPNISIEDIDN